MSNHSLVKAGLCVGLMAASLGAVAGDRHTFAEPMIYYKVTGAAVNYVAFIPSMQGTGVLMLDLYQSGTSSSWAYAAAAAVNAAAGGAAWSVSASNSTDSNNAGSFTVKYYDVLGNTSGVNWGTTSSGVSTDFSSSWYGGDTQTVSLEFTQAQTISSQACDVSFGASLNTDDYLVFAGFTMRPGSAYPSASDSVSWRTKSGTSTSDYASIGSAAWNASNFSATSAFPTFSAFSIPAANGGAGQTVAASVISKANLCVGNYTAKAALNAAGGFIGAKAGLMRLW